MGTQFVSFAKRINAANNSFLGVVLVGVRLTYLQKIYQSIASLPDQSFVLLHRDGTIILRYPEFKDRVFEKISAELPWYRLVAQGGGTYRLPDYIDSAGRLVAVRPLRDYALVVNVGIAEAAALATWRTQAIILGIGTGLVMLCVAFLIRAQYKQYNRLATSAATVDAALNNIVQGVMMFDANARLIVCNQRYLDMYGLSRDIVKPGATLEEIVKHRTAVGGFEIQSAEQYVSDFFAAIGRGTAFSRTSNLRDGRIIHVVTQPIEGGGWVTTHEDVTEAKRAEERIAYLAYHDPLTGLPNRKLFYEQLEQALKRVQRGERLAVLYLDLDHLKRINDTLGHSAGDKLIKDVADRLRGCVRDVDVVARLSGDEFAIIQTSLNQNSDAAVLAMRVREAVHEPFDLDGNRVVIDISVGISVAPDDATPIRRFVENRRYRALRSQEPGTRHLLLLRGGHECAHAGPRRAGAGSARRARQRRIRAVLPADRQPGRQQDHIVRGALALASPQARPGLASRVHPHCRGDRAHRPAGRMGPANGVRRGGELAGRHSRCRQRVVGSVEQQELGQCRHRRHSIGQYKAEPAGAGDHRIGSDAEHVCQPGDPEAPARDRRAFCDGRFWHRLLLARLSAEFPIS